MMDVHTPVTLVHLLLVCFVTKHCSLSVGLEYSLCPLPKLADERPFNVFQSLRNNFSQTCQHMLATLNKPNNDLISTRRLVYLPGKV